MSTVTGINNEEVQSTKDVFLEDICNLYELVSAGRTRYYWSTRVGASFAGIPYATGVGLTPTMKLPARN